MLSRHEISPRVCHSACCIGFAVWKQARCRVSGDDCSRVSKRLHINSLGVHNHFLY